MGFRLAKSSLSLAVDHMHRFGDTDIFPHLPELLFFAEQKSAVVDELAALDLDSYSPGGAMECLAPKSRYGFRIAHQLGAVDSILLLASVIEIAPSIERVRQPGPEAFSYRFGVGPNGQIFLSGRSFKAWLKHQENILSRSPAAFTKVLYTDISDFYQRINFHRLENYLDECAAGHGASRFIKKHIKAIRAKQSFGLPVGGAASRLLAELTLCDTDKLLADQGILATRFVDDFRIFLRAGEDPYEVLALLADHLAINEGLSLNVSKTLVLSASEFAQRLSASLTDIDEHAEEAALTSLTADIYMDDDPDPDDVEKLKNLNLIGFLEGELSKDSWDVGHIKVIFRALRITRKPESIDYIKENFGRLLMFAKELALLMQELERDENGCFDDMLDVVIDAILKPPASSVHLIQAWLLELFVRGVIDIPLSKIRRLETLSFPLHKRQLLLIRGRKSDTNYFRRQKTAADQYSTLELPCLVWGAGCLPQDELSNWLPSIKSKLKTPTSVQMCDWILKNKNSLSAKLGTPLDEHVE